MNDITQIRVGKNQIGIMGLKEALADVEYVRDLDEIARYGVMGTPALIINGDVKAVGNVPTKSKLKTWLDKAING